MRRPQRLIAVTVLAAFSIVLAGCSSGNFDPTDMMDWFDTKKKLPGDRKPVFPEGVPGVEQGVPRDLYRGGHQQPDQPPVVEAPPPAPEPRAKSRKSGSNTAPRSVAPAASSADQGAPESDEGVAAAPPAPPPAKRKRTSITAPPPDPQPQQVPPPPPQAAPPAFPAPLPSGGFSR